jgi:hypothetical protein
MYRTCMGKGSPETWPVSALGHVWISCPLRWSCLICQRLLDSYKLTQQGHLRRLIRPAAVKTECETSPYRMQVLLFVVTLGSVTRVASARCQSGPLCRARQNASLPIRSGLPAFPLSAASLPLQSIENSRTCHSIGNRDKISLIWIMPTVCATLTSNHNTSRMRMRRGHPRSWVVHPNWRMHATTACLH